MSAVKSSEWLDTPALCKELTISRSSLSRWRHRGLLSPGQHWMRKNPACPRSDLLWHRHRCSALLGPSAFPRCRSMRQPLPSGTNDFVLIHRDTGSALYTTRATEAEIYGANANLRQSEQGSTIVRSGS